MSGKDSYFSLTVSENNFNSQAVLCLVHSIVVYSLGWVAGLKVAPIVKKWFVILLARLIRLKVDYLIPLWYSGTSGNRVIFSSTSVSGSDAT